MNIKLLRRIQRQILKEPKQFHMRRLFVGNNDGEPIPWLIPNCGTAACFGGWAIALTSRKSLYEARELTHILPHQVLKLDLRQFERLCQEQNWPRRFRGGKTPETRAKRAVARIDFFIKTNGTDKE